MKFTHGKSNPSVKTGKALESIARERSRTSLLWKYEQRAIAFLVQHIPGWISSDMLTAIGFLGNVLVSVSFILAAYIDHLYLLLNIAGFGICWFGDSLDGRIAYYRNNPRKWYGFSLDIIIDWIGIVLIGLGYIVYVKGIWELLGYGFVVMYGWEMIIALIRYRITDKYSIDSGPVGPTEVRIILSAILVAEVFLPGSIRFSAAGICVILFIVNIFDTVKLLKTADERDVKERKEPLHQAHD
ncbi:MAG: CDP-alcohol phosphatidyltransferase [Bacteroidales bacterium]|nr:CDP-alcohol phosphatidyltransferase family protein [Lentimicrobiaceae bacterium]MDD5695629.1 CDP-alcohol phosphatidyltransferase [Bacteroidales bacterium]